MPSGTPGHLRVRRGERRQQSVGRRRRSRTDRPGRRVGPRRSVVQQSDLDQRRHRWRWAPRRADPRRRSGITSALRSSTRRPPISRPFRALAASSSSHRFPWTVRLRCCVRRGLHLDHVIKTAAPTELPVGGGPVTYSYEVRNTGDVPLAGVAARLVDDTCSPVAYVSGDLDGDGLLDSPNSIFEDAADEVWIFTCTTMVAATTTNTVVVTGSPTDDLGVALCGPSRLSALRVAPACDVTDNASAVATVPLRVRSRWPNEPTRRRRPRPLFCSV